MKRRIWKYGIVAAVLLAMLLTVTACGGSSGGSSSGGGSAAPAAETPAPETTTEAFDPVGNYKAVVVMTDFVNQGMEESGIAFKADVTTDAYMELTADNKYQLHIDVDSLVASMKEVFQEEGPQMFKDILHAQGLSDDDIAAAAEAGGFESVDAMINDMMSMSDDMWEEVGADLGGMPTDVDGTYTIDGNKLTLSSGEEGIFAPDGSFTLDGKITGDDEPLKMTFIKQ